MDNRIYRDSNSGLLVDLTDAPPIQQTDWTEFLQAMERLEAGAFANMDENRQVGHYWLRNPELAPTPELQQALADCEHRLVRLQPGDHDTLLWIGIGGSALGPQLLHQALSRPTDPLRVHFLDNVDPHGIESVLSQIDPCKTLVVVVSKSGGTVETSCALTAAETWWAQHGEPFAQHAIAITGEGSILDQRAQTEGWQASLPVWDWVGGRTSVTGTVGQVLMQLCGWDRPGLLAGAHAADQWCRQPATQNPALQLAALFHQQSADGIHGLVMQPYSDALSLISRYLQQLIMESIGKNLDRKGESVEAGILVLGNKGATDQHALMQQILDGRRDALCCFLDTAERDTRLRDANQRPLCDHLFGMLEGTREALRERNRPTLLIQVPSANAHGLGLIIALFERVVGLWAEMLDINAYHQPAVESGKRAAKATLQRLDAIEAALTNDAQSAAELAHTLQADTLQCWRLLHHLAQTGRAHCNAGERPATDRFYRT